jgi:hypothetical protein
MPVANFFDKAALAAHEVLQDFSSDRFAATLDAVNIRLVFDDAVAESPEGTILLELLVNLLARLFPRLALDPDGNVAIRLAERLDRSARAINPAISMVQGAGVIDSVVVAVGARTLRCAGPVLYAGADGWVAHISTRGPAPLGGSRNPFGAAAAACLAAANVFRAVFEAQLPCADLDRDLALSLIDLDPTAVNPRNPDIAVPDLQSAALAGVGAIGNAFCWVLARVPGIRGQLDLVDPEQVSLSNLQRYVLMNQVHAERGAFKVDVAADYFAPTGIDARPHRLSWGGYMRQRQDWMLDRVAVALDSADARRAVQAALPRRVFNAWTQPEDVGVSRHGFGDDHACLCCLYFPAGAQPNDDQVVARAIGLPGAEREVRLALMDGGPIGNAWTERIAKAVGVAPEALARFADLPLRAFYQEAVCGGVILALGGTSVRVRAQAPMAFQSAFAGVLLASELVVDATGLRPHTAQTTSTFDLLRPIGKHPSQWRAKQPDGRCICQDPLFVRRYREKYQSGSVLKGP